MRKMKGQNMKREEMKGWAKQLQIAGKFETESSGDGGAVMVTQMIMGPWFVKRL